MENVLVRHGKTNKVDHVERIQRALKIPSTGRYDKETMLFVQHWQKENGLTNDGIVGNITWSKLVLESEKAIFDVVKIDDLPFDISGLKHNILINVYQELPNFIKHFGLKNANQLAYFLGQCAHESGNFRITEENLNYSAEGLMRTFPVQFAFIDHAKEFEHQPERIANYIYARKNGNGMELTGDGWKYRGRGYIQITGRYNYREISKLSGIDLVTYPDKAAKEYALLVSGYFFQMRKIWPITDSAISDPVITQVTRLINPALLGLKDRSVATYEFSELLSG